MFLQLNICLFLSFLHVFISSDNKGSGAFAFVVLFFLWCIQPCMFHQPPARLGSAFKPCTVLKQVISLSLLCSARRKSSSGLKWLTGFTYSHILFYQEWLATEEEKVRLIKIYSQAMPLNLEIDLLICQSFKMKQDTPSLFPSATYSHSGVAFRLDSSASILLDALLKKAKPHVHFFLTGAVDNDGVQADSWRDWKEKTDHPDVSFCHISIDKKEITLLCLLQVMQQIQETLTHVDQM